MRRLHPDVDDAQAAALVDEYASRRQRDRDMLDAMIAYAQSALCRWHLLLRYFGESIDGGACGTCDNCRNHARHDLRAAS